MPNGLMEKLYYKMPISAQNGIFSLYGWNLARKRYGHSFKAHLERLKRMEWWSKEEIEAYQNKKVIAIVKHAYTTVPFYQKWYQEHGVDINHFHSIADLKTLPILTKQIVRENQVEMVSCLYKKSALQKGLTSGTTGTPLTIYKTSDAQAYQWAIWWRHKARFGLTIKDRHLTFGARVPIDQNQSRPPYWLNDYANNRVYLSSYHINKETLTDIVDYLNSTYFDFYTGYPSAMYVLASLMEEENLRLYNRPKYIVTGADALLPKYEAVISRVFGAPVTEQYGVAEFAGNMSKCEHGKFHLDFECGYIEAQTGVGSDYQNLLMTGWVNDAMPFIRYEIGDYGRKEAGFCDCGRKTACFSQIEGRLEDHVITPDGRKLIGMNQVFEYAKNAREIQIFQQDTKGIEFRIVATKQFDNEDKNALIREFQRRAGKEMKISFKMVDTLERSATGKLKAVISQISTPTNDLK